MKIENPFLLRIELVFIAHDSYLLVEMRAKKLCFPVSIKHFLCQRGKISMIHQRKNISDSLKSRDPTYSLIRLLEPHVLKLSPWVSPRMLGLPTR